MIRLNITLPEELYKELKPIPNKSRFIAETLRDRLERQKKEKLDKLLIEGYKATKEEDKKLNEEWENITQSNQIRTIDKKRLIKLLGKISEEKIKEVEQAILIHLGFET